MQKAWTKPKFILHGSIEDITSQTFTKQAGSGDSIVFIIGNTPVTITDGQRGTISAVSGI